jgi:hypothetical protein
MSNSNNHTKIKFRPGYIDIDYRIFVNDAEEEKQKYFDCFVPGFNLKFSATSVDDIDVRAKAMVVSFFNYHKQQKSNLNELVLEIHRMGFRSPKHNYVVKEILNKRMNDASFNSCDANIPENFINSNVREAQLTEAV